MIFLREPETLKEKEHNDIRIYILFSAYVTYTYFDVFSTMLQ
jgi:hypothetical protein